MTDDDAAAPTFLLRAAEPADVQAIDRLIHELAAFERLSHLVQSSADRLREHLFGNRPVAEACVAEVAGEVVAFALFFTNYSTFLARPGIYLEDLYVRSEHRGRGIGEALIRRVAQLAQARGCGRFEWSVLDWNGAAIGFYEKMGAAVMADWRICRVTGEALAQLGTPVRPAR